MRLRSIVVSLALTAVAVGSSGCATIFTDSQKEVTFRSDPEGARVEVDGGDRGKTPVTVTLDAKKWYRVRIRKKGYETYEGTLDNEVGLQWVLLDVVFLGAPILIDAFTGAWYQFENDTVSVALEKKGGGESEDEQEQPTPVAEPKKFQLPEEARDLSAKKLFRRGAKRYNERKFAEALAYFQAAHEKSPSPVLLYNIAFAHSRLGEHEEALSTIDRIEDREKLGDKVRTKLEALEAANRLIVRGHRVGRPDS